MTTKAIITCDVVACSHAASFPKESSPPASWFVLRHPVRKPRGRPDGILCGEVVTFCSPRCLAAWANDLAEARREERSTDGQ